MTPAQRIRAERAARAIWEAYRPSGEKSWEDEDTSNFGLDRPGNFSGDSPRENRIRSAHELLLQIEAAYPELEAAFKVLTKLAPYPAWGIANMLPAPAEGVPVDIVREGVPGDPVATGYTLHTKVSDSVLQKAASFIWEHMQAGHRIVISADHGNHQRIINEDGSYEEINR